MRYMPEYDATAAYDDMLDEVYEDVQIAGYSYSTSNALKNVDPIAYRTGMSDWLDSEGITTDESEADEESDDEDNDGADETPAECTRCGKYRDGDPTGRGLCGVCIEDDAK